MIIYTDGSCQGNGKDKNTGGFGVVLLDKDENFLYNYSKRCENTTNNREEIKAILYSFLNYGIKTNNNDWNCVAIPIVYSDSNYCVQTFNTWMFGWERNGWIKSSDKKPPENLDLIKAYYDWYQKGYRIDLRKVKGHAGNQWNEMADGLATGRINPVHPVYLTVEEYNNIDPKIKTTFGLQYKNGILYYRHESGIDIPFDQEKKELLKDPKAIIVRG